MPAPSTNPEQDPRQVHSSGVIDEGESVLLVLGLASGIVPVQDDMNRLVFKLDRSAAARLAAELSEKSATP